MEFPCNITAVNWKGLALLLCKKQMYREIRPNKSRLTSYLTKEGEKLRTEEDAAETEHGQGEM